MLGFVLLLMLGLFAAPVFFIIGIVGFVIRLMFGMMFFPFGGFGMYRGFGHHCCHHHHHGWWL